MERKKKRDGGLIQGWGFAKVCVAGGQGKEGVEGADGRDRWRRWALGVKLEERAGRAGR